MALRIVILGAPGAGKGTQAKRIARKYKVPHISTGEIFRGHVRNKTELGCRIEQSLDNGHLMSDELTCEVLWSRLMQPDCAQGYVLDGFPRSLPQAEALNQWLAARDEQLQAALELVVPDAEIIERTEARRSCPQCGAIFNLKYDKPGQTPHCDRPDCKSEMTQRHDDTAETVRERLRIFHSTARPIEQYFKELGILLPVECATLSPNEVFEKVEHALHRAGASKVS